MDELRWLLIILGALVIVAIYLHGTIQNWRHDGPPWARQRRDQREPFADREINEPHLDDAFGEPLQSHDVAAQADTEDREWDDVGRGPELSDDDAVGDISTRRADGSDDEPVADDDFPAWARSRAEAARTPAEDWPVPEPESAVGSSETGSRGTAGGEPVAPRADPPRAAPASTPELHDTPSRQDSEGGGRRWSRGRLSQRLRQALAGDAERSSDPAGGGASAAPEAAEAVPEGLEEKIVVINVAAPSGDRFLGPAVQYALHRAGLEFGEHGIYHHYVDGARVRVTQFSVANIVNPGWFDPDRMDEFETPGLAFFLRLPGPFDAVTAFEAMLAAARRVAADLRGQLLDSRRCDLTHQSVEHLREEMIEYRRRAELARRQQR